MADNTSANAVTSGAFKLSNTLKITHQAHLAALFHLMRLICLATGSLVVVLSIVATALRLGFESTEVTEMGSSRAQYLRSGHLDATRSECTLLTRDTEQQLSKGKGSRSPADVTEVQALLNVQEW